MYGTYGVHAVFFICVSLHCYVSFYLARVTVFLAYHVYFVGVILGVLLRGQVQRVHVVSFGELQLCGFFLHLHAHTVFLFFHPQLHHGHTR